MLGGETIAGRTAGVALSPLGRDQVSRMVERLSGLPIRAVYSSPLQRTLETARPLGAALGLDVRVLDALSEIDFGDWSGAKLSELRPLERWKQWNAFRSGTAP